LVVLANLFSSSCFFFFWGGGFFLRFLRFVSLVLGLVLGLQFVVPVAANAVVGSDLAGDYFSARVHAVLTGHRVLVVDALTADSTTWVNPDGSQTVDTYGSAIRVPDVSSVTGWRDLDFSLRFEVDGRVEPVYGLWPISLSGGGDSELVSVVSSGGQSFGFGFDGVLPTPVLSGEVARYSEVLPGVDLLVRLDSSGFEQSFELKQRPSQAVLDRLALLVQGRDVSVVSDGASGFRFVVAGGSVARVLRPVVFDSGDVPVSGDVSFEQVSSRLVFGVSSAFLDNPDLVYPVIVDPAVTLGAALDTYVTTDDPTGVYDSSPDLWVGTMDGGPTVYRSYLNFDSSAWRGQDVVSANLNLYLAWSGSCSPKYFSVFNTAPATSSTSWSNAPSLTGAASSRLAAAGFNSSCPSAYVNTDVTSLVRAVAPTIRGAAGFGIRASSETDIAALKQFNSSNAASNKPYLSITYNRPPGVAATPDVADSSLVSGGRVVGSLRPAFSSQATDPDADDITLTYKTYADASSLTPLATLCSVTVANATFGTCRSTVALTDGQTYFVRAASFDGRVAAASLSPAVSFRVSAAAPVTPVVSCPYVNGYQAGSTSTSSFSCTITTSASAGEGKAAKVLVSVNDGSPQTFVANADGSSSNTVTIPGGAYQYRLKATAESATGIASSDASYVMSFGTVGIITPLRHVSSASQVVLSGYGVPLSSVNASSAAVEWRKTGDSNWNLAASGLGLATGFGVKALNNYRLYLNNLGASGQTPLPSNVPVSLDLRLCFTYAAIVETFCSDDTALQATRLPSGLESAVGSAGLASVSLVSGQVSLSASDLNIPIGLNALSVSRSFIGVAAANLQSSVFGNGWSANFGNDAGAVSGYTLSSDPANNHFYLTDDNQNILEYIGTSGLLTPVTDEAVAANLKIVLASNTFTVTDQANAVTVYSHSSTTDWQLKCERDTSISRAVVSLYGSNGLLTDNGYAANNQSGCSATTVTQGLHYVYTTFAYGTRLTQVNYVYLDANGSQVSVPQVSYRYDSSGRLNQQINLSNGSSTSYEFLASGLISKISVSGLAPWVYKYDAIGRLTQVQRANDAFWNNTPIVEKTFVYDLPVAGNSGFMPNLTAATTCHWGVSDAPIYAAAVFGADTNISLDANGSPVLPLASNTSWRNAQVTYLDAKLHVSNTASYGKDQWLFTASVFNDDGSVRAVFNQQGSLNVLARYAAEGSDAFDENMYATYNTYLTQIRSVAVPSGMYLAESWSPIHTVTDNGVTVHARTHTKHVYDVGAPTSELYGLETSTTVGLTYGATLSSTDSSVLRTITNSYDPQDGSSTTGASSGWVLGQPTWVRVYSETGALASETKTVFNEYGQQTKHIGNGSNGFDARTSNTAYYSTAANTLHPECGLHAAWQDLPCVTETGEATPTSANHTASYDEYLRPSVSQQLRSGVVARTVTNSFLADGRIDTSTITAVNTTSTTKHVYDNVSLLETKTQLYIGQTLQSQTQASYDAWGRNILTTNSLGETTTTSYVAAGQLGAGAVNTATTTKTTTTYTYGATSEPRALLTAMTQSANDGSFNYTHTASYDQLGRLVAQQGPNGITQSQSYNDAGQIVNLAYILQGSNGNTTLTWGRNYDGLGRVTSESSPNATTASFNNDRTTTYSYDPASRLTTAQTTTPTSCSTESYSYDQQGNRLTAATGICGATSNTTHTYNTQSQLTNTGYIYDQLGRNTYVPAEDTPTGGNPISLTYNNLDQVTSITSNTNTTNYTYDAQGRRLNETNNNQTITRHYTNNTDNPSYTTQQDTQNQTTECYLASLGAGLNITINIKNSVKTASIQINDPHGNTVTTINLDTNTPTSYTNYDSYGNPQTPTSNNNLINYTSYNQQQRATTATGLILMGARVYNPKNNQFTSIDPINGGNENNYTYPNDPINNNDFNGLDNSLWDPSFLFAALASIPGTTTEIHNSATKFISKLISQITGPARRARLISVARSVSPEPWITNMEHATGQGVYFFTIGFRVYVGQTIDIVRRLGEHWRTYGLQIKNFHFVSTPGQSEMDRRILEQQIMDGLGGIQGMYSNADLINAINSLRYANR
jgi:RHS repeat-associated protein